MITTVILATEAPGVLVIDPSDAALLAYVLGGIVFLFTLSLFRGATARKDFDVDGAEYVFGMLFWPIMFAILAGRLWGEHERRRRRERALAEAQARDEADRILRREGIHLSN